MINGVLPDLYLDVDGVLLLEHEINRWLFGLIGGNLFRFSRIFWLSSWTRTGDTKKLYAEFPIFKSLNATPLNWKNDKTEAIDWTRPFVWIEDGVTDAERAAFRFEAKRGQFLWEVSLRLTGTPEEGDNAA